MLALQMQNLSAKDFYSATKFNQDTKNQLWMSMIADSHDCTCDCDTPFAHLLASIFPPGHKDRNLTINQILARDYTEKCRSGGAGEESHGMVAGDESADTTHIKDEEEDLPGEEIEKLLEEAANESAR